MPEQPMPCERCQGFTVHEEVNTAEGGVRFRRCFNCGHRFDEPLITLNREHPDWALLRGKVLARGIG